MTWYLQSINDHDTHHGELNADGTVATSCGLKFQPKQLPLGRVSLRGYPPDPNQICPACDIRRKEGAR